MGKSKSQTIGFKYFMGLQFVWCLGPVDAVLELIAGDRIAWGGQRYGPVEINLEGFRVTADYPLTGNTPVTASEQIFINAPNLFGGERKEGGLQGALDVMMGEPTQVANTYLLAKQGAPQPAYRGLLTMVYRGGLIASLNPYVKPWALRVRRIVKGWYNDECWYEAAAKVPLVEAFIGNRAWFFVVDTGASMATVVSGSDTRLDIAKATVSAALDRIRAILTANNLRIDVGVAAFGETYTAEVRTNANGADLAELQTFVDGLTPAGDSHFDQGIAPAIDFFAALNDQGVINNHRSLFFVTDGVASGTTDDTAAALASDLLDRTGQYTVALGTAVDLYGINVDLADTTATAKLDNTPDDSVPVVADASTTALVDTFGAERATRYGMNPAHIVYQCLTDPSFGLGYPAAMIDDDSFTAAADTLLAEGFGLCLRWNNECTIEEFIAIVADHAGAVVAPDRRTGLWRMLLMRQDYDIGTLRRFDASSCKVVRAQQPSLQDTVNEVTVTYKDVVTGKPASVTVHNLANIQGQGRVVQQSLSFDGLPTHALAARVAQRELMARSTPLWKLSMEMDRTAWDLLPGEPYVVEWPPLGFEIVVRAGELDYGTVVDGKIRAENVEDVFGLPLASYVVEQPNVWTPPDTAPAPPRASFVFEIPYRDLVQALPPAELAGLADDAGYVAAVAARPAGAGNNFALYTRQGSAPFETLAEGDFAPGGVLVNAVAPLDDVLTLTAVTDLDELVVNSAAFLGDGADAEMVRIDDVDTATGEVTVGRGCGDTVPKAWPAGTRLWAYDQYTGDDPTEYADGDVVDAKVITRTATGEYPQGLTATQTITLDQRAFRPYPPGQFEICGDGYPGKSEPLDVEVTWVHRDRLLQADQLVDSLAATVGPEAGTTYTVRYYLDGVLAFTDSGLTTSPSTWTAPTIGVVTVELEAVRDGLTSWQTHTHTFVCEGDPDGFLRATEDGQLRTTEDDLYRATEP